MRYDGKVNSEGYGGTEGQEWKEEFDGRGMD